MKESIGKWPVSKAVPFLKKAAIHSTLPINSPRGLRINRAIVERSLKQN